MTSMNFYNLQIVCGAWKGFHSCPELLIFNKGMPQLCWQNMVSSINTSNSMRIHTEILYIYTHQRASLWNGYNLICPVQILHIFIQTLYFTNMNFKEYRITQTNWCHAGEVLIQGTQTKLLIQSNLKAKHPLYNNISFNNYIHMHQNPFQ